MMGGLYDLFQEDNLQLLMPNKRARFFNSSGCIGKSPSFKSIYICRNFLQYKNIEWFKLDTTRDPMLLKKYIRLARHRVRITKANNE